MHAVPLRSVSRLQLSRIRRDAKVRSLSCATALALIAFCCTHLIAATVPADWTATDLNTPAHAGSTDVANETWTLVGGGSGICPADQYHLVWRSLDGDATIIARLLSVESSEYYAQGGLVFRDPSGGLAASLLLTSSNGISFQVRSVAGGSCSFFSLGGIYPPLSLRLSRRGEEFSAFFSSDGTNWSMIGVPQVVPMAPTAMVGLAASANNNAATCTVRLADVQLPPPAFGVYRETWSLPDASAGIVALTDPARNPDWPDAPETNHYQASFETPVSSRTNYGARLRAYVVPSVTGAYTFTVASDDVAAVRLGIAPESYASATIAQNLGPTGFREWNRETNQRSAPLLLQAGQRYILEALTVQSAGTGHFSIRLEHPDGHSEEPLAPRPAPGTALIPVTGQHHLPGIYRQPTNLTVGDSAPAVFSVLVTNPAPVFYRWLLNGAPVSETDGSGSVFAIPAAGPAHQDATLACIVSNSVGVVTSTVARLTVILDQTAPALLFAQYINATNVHLFFSEPLEPASATDIANYSITNGVTIQQAVLEPGGTAVSLVVSPLTKGSNYGVFARNVRDRASVPNSVATNSFVPLLAAPYVLQGIGNTPPGSTMVGAGDGYDFSGGGADIGSASTDGFTFAYQSRRGDFDISVQIQNLAGADQFAKAGLIASEDLNPRGRYAGVLATPSLGGVFFSARTFFGSKAATTGIIPVNFPNLWLRLRRSGDEFSGFASYDGTVWHQLGTATMELADLVYLGMAVSSGHSNRLVEVQFRDIAEVTNALTGVLPVLREPLGPSSRRTPIVFSEIMYHPAPRQDGRVLEYIEIFNSQAYYEDISGYRLSGDVQYTFPPGTVLGSGAHLVIAANPADIKTVYGIENVVGPYTNELPDGSGAVQLLGRAGAVLLDLEYESEAPWPVAADGTGHSLELARPSFGEGDARAWSASDRKGGSPGRIDGITFDPARAVVINEYLANSDPPLADYIELFNCETNPVDISGCALSDTARRNKFVIPPGTVIPGRGWVHFDEAALGFALNAEGEAIYFVNAGDTRVLDCWRFAGESDGIASGRFPDGAPETSPLSERTPGAANAAHLAPAVVISELLYDPVSLDEQEQFVELYNRTSGAVSLNGWRFTSGISFLFPASAEIGPREYLVVAANRLKLLTNYPGVLPGNVYGDFSGSLAGRGERVVLSRPEWIVTTNSQGLALTNVAYVPVDWVTYSTGGRWGKWSDKGGSSLELIDAEADNALAANWADSDETAEAPWTLVEATGVLDNGNGTADQLHVILQGAGECLVDNVEVLGPDGVNRIANGAFNQSTAGWTFQGTHRASLLNSTGGYLGGPALHVRASGRGDTGANRIRVQLSSSLTPGTIGTIRARVRWLKGNPEILLRLRGNYLEAAARLDVTRTPGTPAAPNSRRVPNAGPAIWDVVHAPVLPAAGRPVQVTARVADPQGVVMVTLVYRNDTAATPGFSVPMKDDGIAPDGYANDGIYTGEIPGLAARTIVAFYIIARDGAATAGESRFPDNAPERECLIGFGETMIPGSLGTYRTWITRNASTYWSTREKNSNDPIDATFVYGNSRVIYNMETLYSGSPFHTRNYTSPTGSTCDYVLHFPDDERVLGANDFVLCSTGNLGNDNTAQREQAAFWLLRELGVPSLYRRYVHVFVNGTKRGLIMEDTQQPSGDLVEQYYPEDADGQLFKIEDWFEFDNAGSSFVNIDATLQNFTTTGGQKKAARYRWNWRPRAVEVSANDFTNLYQLVDAVTSPRPEPYTTLVDSIVDVDGWMRTLAVERIVGNWDSWGFDRGKNMYAYRPQRGKWQLMAWDIDFVMDLGRTGSLTGGQDPALNTMWSHPPFLRAYWRAIHDAVYGPMEASRINPLVDAKYTALLANGVSASAPTPIKTYITSRRTALITQLNTVAASFTASATVANNMANLTGTAPVSVKTLRFNGVEYPVTWSSTTSWNAAVPLNPGANPITVTGIGSDGAVVPGATRNVSATYAGPTASPSTNIVISEIMANPAVPGAEFVELRNVSPTLSFDLSGWEINGLGYAFPAGSVFRQNSYLILARDRQAFASAYGSTLPLFDVYEGNLQRNGETLTLLRPGDDPVVTRVRYSNRAPWPDAPAGSSLQLVDALRDNWRVGNWAVAQSNAVAEPQWINVIVTGNAPSSRLYVYLQSAGEIYLDDMTLVTGSIPGQGVNRLANGGFESSLAGSWTATANFAQSGVSTAIKRSGNASLRLVATAAGSGNNNSIYQNISPALAVGSPYTLSLWYRQTGNGGPLVVRLSGSGFTTGSINPAPPGGGPVQLATPGKANSVSRSVMAFPTLWINEIQAENLTGLTNQAGQRSPWIEIFNPGSATVSLNNLFLSDDYGNLAAWPFPNGVSIPPRQFKTVFADGTGISTGELHTNFRLPSRDGRVVLTRWVSTNDLQVLDHVEYSGVAADRSFGSAPDAQSFARRELFFPTPGASNNLAAPAATIVINEWMADNDSVVLDPADDDLEDWFELYNPGDTPVDLGGFYLTDDLNNKTKFLIPGGGTYTVPPGGFLLVWADGEPDQNSSSSSALHASFSLARGGEALGVFAPDGTPVDTVTFGEQTTDVSAGRFPDGYGPIGVLGEPSPGTGNLGPNMAPVLSHLPARSVFVGQLLQFIAAATDPEAPPQTLSFGLGFGAPAGAAIDESTGLFRWVPANAGTYDLTVTVTDSGRPRLTASRTFTVTALPLPNLSGITVDGPELSFEWYGASGASYQVETCIDLAAGMWTPAGAVAAGANAPLVFSAPIAPGVTQVFYRIVVVP